MKDLSKSIEYSGCHKCIANSAHSCKNCKKYKTKLKAHNSKVIKSQEKLDQVKRVVNQRLPNILPSRFRNFYYTDRHDINFWSQLNYQRFSSIEHLVSYILNSNNIQPSQLALECRWDLGKLPQIKYLVSKNEDLLRDTPVVEYRSYKLQRNDIGVFRYIYNPNFWYKLIQNYIMQQHRYVVVFYLKDFDIRIAPQPLMVAIYCCGYIYFDHKSDELTEYINQLGNANYKRIKFKPSLTNIQALLIHQFIFYFQKKIAEARSCLLHITKMSYMLGFHRNTTKLSKSAIDIRNLVYTRVLYTHLAMTKAHKVNVNFEVDIPDIYKVCYDLDRQLLSKATAQLIRIKEEERNLISALTTLNIELEDKSWLCLVFPNIESYTNMQIYKICLDKYASLCSIHSKYTKGYEVLLNNFHEHTKLLVFDREGFDAHYLYLGILIFEYGRLKSKGVNHKIVQKMVNLCDDLMTVALISNTDHFHDFGIYLTVFTCVQIFKYLRQSQQKKLISNLSIVKNLLFNNLSESTLLTYLLFDKSIELIKC